jgi:hypothetical protein
MLTRGTAAGYPHIDGITAGSRRSQVADTRHHRDHAGINANH